jgi:hypothetical protein
MIIVDHEDVASMKILIRDFRFIVLRIQAINGQWKYVEKFIVIYGRIIKLPTLQIINCET